MRDPKARAELLLSERFMNLATTDGGVPWACAVAFVRRGSRLYFYSGKNSRHATHIAKNPNVSGHLWRAADDEIDGLQFSTTCRELRAEEVPAVADQYFTELFPDPEERAWWLRPLDEFSGEGKWRFYELVIHDAYLIDNDVFEDSKLDARLHVHID